MTRVGGGSGGRRTGGRGKGCACSSVTQSWYNSCRPRYLASSLSSRRASKRSWVKWWPRDADRGSAGAAVVGVRR